jgi:lipopolysaccharide export system permease protein
MLALSLFIAIAATLGRMYRDSEMTIWFSSGVGLSRFLSPVLQMSWPVLLVVGLLALGVWPWVNEKTEELKQRYQGRSDLARVAPGQFQTSKDGRRVFFIDRDDQASQIGRNVFILSRNDHTESVVTARSGRIEINADQQFLVLEQGQRSEENLRSGETSIYRFETYRVMIGDKVPDSEGKLPAKARQTLDLLLDPTPINLGEVSWRLGLFLGAGNLMLLAIGLSSTNPRRANNWNLLLALLSFIVYYNLINLTRAWVASDKLNIQQAMGAIHGGVFVLGILLLWWRDHGTVLSWRPWRRP